MSCSPLFKFFAPLLAASLIAACGGGDTPSADKPKSTDTPPVQSNSTTDEVAPEPKAASTTPKLSDQEALLKRGKIVWFKCRSCHDTSADGRHKVGPNLHNIMGASAGVKEGFVFSKAMKESEVVWDEESLDAFITRPTSFVKGTKMAFVGISKEYDRQAVIAYIKENTK